MDILDSYIISLRFKIYKSAPVICLDKWKELKDICEYNTNNENKKINNSRFNLINTGSGSFVSNLQTILNKIDTKLH